MIRLSFICLAIWAGLTACDSDRHFEDQKDFATRAWNVTDTAHFQFRVEDTGIPYNLYYTVRNSIDYPYARLFTNYHLRDSLGRTLMRELNTAYLFDLKTGEPKGSSGLGDLYDHRFTLVEGYRFSQPGLYTVALTQAMREDSLSGVMAVGFRIEKAKK